MNVGNHIFQCTCAISRPLKKGGENPLFLLIAVTVNKNNPFFQSPYVSGKIPGLVEQELVTIPLDPKKASNLTII